tara:strand:- start:1316 stop:1927 length:612 start_codon:yes stop_codon:yes gene_type:complete
MSKYLLREYYELCEGGVCSDLLTEAEKKIVADGGLILTGIMQKCNELNGNGRIYPEKTLVREVENYKKLVRENRAVGELDHPETSVVELKNVSHKVTDLWMDGAKVMGKIRVLNTPSGNILRGLVESDVAIGISSRGLGSVSEQAGQTIVEDDFQLICFDVVSEPSTTGAFLVAEGLEKSLNTVFTKSDRINRTLNDIIRIGE